MSDEGREGWVSVEGDPFGVVLTGWRKEVLDEVREALRSAESCRGHYDPDERKYVLEIYRHAAPEEATMAGGDSIAHDCGGEIIFCQERNRADQVLAHRVNVEDGHLVGGSTDVDTADEWYECGDCGERLDEDDVMRLVRRQFDLEDE